MSQNMQALAQANATRIEIADLKRGVRNGSVGIDEALLTADYRKLTVGKLLSSVPRVSEARAEKFLDGTMIRPDKPMAELTDRQRQMLAAAARERYPRAVKP